MKLWIDFFESRSDFFSVDFLDFSSDPIEKQGIKSITNYRSKSF